MVGERTFRQGLPEVYDDTETETMAEEHTRLSPLANKRTSSPSLVLEDKASEPYDLRTVGVCTRDLAETNKPNESVRCKLIREMKAVLRQDQIRAAGTDQECKLRWQIPVQEGTGSGPGHQQPAPVFTGNSASAVAATVLRTQKVFPVISISVFSGLTSV